MAKHPVGWFYGPRQPGTFAAIGPRHPLRWHGLHYASGVFEGIRVYEAPDGNGWNIFRLRDHLERLLRSAHLIGLEPHGLTVEDLERVCVEAIQRNPGDTYLRPIIFRGEGLRVDPSNSPIRAAVFTEGWGPYLTRGLHNDGVRVQLYDWCLISPKAMPASAKTTMRYGMNQYVKGLAIAEGYAEGLMRSWDDRHIGEGTGMNIMLVRENGAILTPDAMAGILPGITRSIIVEIAPEVLGGQWRVAAKPILTAELLSAREVFFTGTATEVMAVTWVRDREIDSGSAGDVTKALQAAYQNIVQGRDRRYAHWLTFVPKRAKAKRAAPPVLSS